MAHQARCYTIGLGEGRGGRGRRAMGIEKGDLSRKVSSMSKKVEASAKKSYILIPIYQ